MTLEEALNESLKLKGGNFITSAFRKWSLDWSKYAVIKLNEKFLDNESILFAIDIVLNKIKDTIHDNMTGQVHVSTFKKIIATLRPFAMRIRSLGGKESD